MFKFLLILALGVAIGYGYGWRDAQQHEKPLQERVLEQVGGKTRAQMGNDIDAKLGQAER
ncbi:MAG: hypothetical protein LCH84_05995 [Gemmatimonadetes bacterium]|nr:hypothetical protein [Gemmatimonadota bacterium]